MRNSLRMKQLLTFANPIENRATCSRFIEVRLIQPPHSPSPALCSVAAKPHFSASMFHAPSASNPCPSVFLLSTTTIHHLHPPSSKAVLRTGRDYGGQL